MYAGAAYAAAPYAGGATVTAAPDLEALAPLLLVGGGVYVEQDFTAPLPEVNAHNYVVALVYPNYDLIGPNSIFPAPEMYPATNLYPQGV